LLGGVLESDAGRGSTFTLYLPATYSPIRIPRKPQAAEPPPLPQAPLLHVPPASLAGRNISPPELVAEHDLVNEFGDDRHDIGSGDRVLLIVENDSGFARFLLDVAHEHGLKVLVTSMGAAALALAKEYKVDAITLDIFLPDMEGWRVLERLKNDIVTRHIPICVISTEEARRALPRGQSPSSPSDQPPRPPDRPRKLPTSPRGGGGACWSSSRTPTAEKNPPRWTWKT
jgi:CheY-like chemotaxis protein